MSETASTGVGAALAFASNNLAPVTKKLTEHTPGDVLLVPKNMEAKDVAQFLDKHLPAPRRKRGTFKLETLTSFLAVVARHKMEDTTEIFATQAGHFTAIFNSHIAPVVDVDAKDQPGNWGDLRATYSPRHSDAWCDWTGAEDGGWMETSKFAAFIDDNIQVVDVPPVAGRGVSDGDKALLDLAKLLKVQFGDREQLMLCSRGLRITSKAEIIENVNTTTGELEAGFVSTHSGSGAKLSVPGLFIITIPVFERGTVFRLPVRLKYRLHEGRTMWGISVLDRDKAEEIAVNDMVEKVQADSKLTVLFGAADLPAPPI